MMATDVEAACLRILGGIEGRADDAGRAWWEGLKWLAKHLVGGTAAECERREHGGDRLDGSGGDSDADHQ
jgi:hypothetical protein